ncbi:ABC transporter ATP-binding protein [Bradyrhizobium sp. LHD-71]|uniref:ABC transporter ATP-binding protein n=1 Tax=Bradyrhizobium sp. LHD-71 TaxID=3072141 RepID=UPI00280D729C|nr:ABC transporter ATP-binding protein [Bradyrhizobium sp. LHD-71]MDQ8726489.1 ABC transporter ATP-binding protein [Bradyrhizobium sp. LHD-71]
MTLAAVKLSYGYPGRTIGRNLSLAVEAGEAVALLGPNGGGKTTLLKTMLGLLPPHAGAVSIDGYSLLAMTVGERARRIAYVPQGHAPAFAFSVRDIVLMGRTAHNGLFASPTAVDRVVVEAKLAELGVRHLLDTPYTMISGGERQLVLIARALVQEPRYVVLDEPTASLDFGNQGKVMRQIRTLTAQGLGVLFTTHDPNQAMRYADRAALLGDGILKAEGAPGNVITRASLQALYGAPVTCVGNEADTAFLPA